MKKIQKSIELNDQIRLNMKIDTLEYFGIPDYITKIWQKHYSPFLLPVQEKAVTHFNLLKSKDFSSCLELGQSTKGNQNLLVVSPSSSGKTLIGEMAALQEISFQKKVIYLVPLRVLAEEKYQHFIRLYQATGLNIRLSSRDHRYDDQDVISGNFHIAIIVYEKFYYLLLQFPQFMSNVSLIIADEIQLINDLKRGPRLENSFNYLKNNYPSLRIIALSAFTEYLFSLAAWLDAQLLFSSFRPVELRKGIVRKGVYQYIEHNSKTNGEESFFSEEEVQEYNLASYLKASLQYLINRQEISLIFFSTKKEVRLWSRWLATQFCLKPAVETIKQLQALEDSTSKEELINLLENGIGYHCADLSWQERRALEDAVRIGELKIICATGTLAMGVNLPVNNVILAGQKVVSLQSKDNSLSSYSKQSLTQSEVENMGGRAGRLNTGNSFGRIIFLAPSLIEFTAYQRLYFQRDTQDLSDLSLSYYPTFGLEKRDKQCNVNYQIQENSIIDNQYRTEDVAVTEIDDLTFATANSFFSEILKDNPVVTEQDILTFLLYKIALDCPSVEEIHHIIKTGKDSKGRGFWNYRFSRKYSNADIAVYLKQLEEEKLVDKLPGGDYRINEMGRLITAKGISFQTYIHFLKWANESEKDNISEVEIIFLIAQSCDGAAYLTDYPGKNYKRPIYKKSSLHKRKEYLRLRFLNLIFEQQEEGKSIFQSILKDTSSPWIKQDSKDMISNYLAIKTTLLMYDWINNKVLREMEEDYGILGGNIQRIGEGFSWLADTLAEITVKIGWKEGRAYDLEKIKQLSTRLLNGITPEGLALAKLQIPGLTRSYIDRLIQEGYNNEQCLHELSEKQLSLLLPELLVRKIKQKINLNPDSKQVQRIHSEFALNTKSVNSGLQPWDDNSQQQKEQKESDTVMTINLDRPDHILFLDEEIPVNKTSFELLLLLAKNKGRVLSYEEIIDSLWPLDEEATYHRLWYHLAKLRKSMQMVIDKKNKNWLHIPTNFLQEKLLRVFPGRGLLLDAEVSFEQKEE